MMIRSRDNDILRAYRRARDKRGETPTTFLALLSKPDWVLVGGTWTPNSVREAKRILRRIAAALEGATE